LTGYFNFYQFYSKDKSHYHAGDGCFLKLKVIPEGFICYFHKISSVR